MNHRRLHHPNLWLFITLCMLIAGLSHPAAAQWRYYDSTERQFQIGAVGLLWPAVGRDSLGIGFSRFYEIAHPGDITHAIAVPDWWNKRLDSLFWHQATGTGYKAIGPLANVSRVSRAARILEHYLGYDTAAIQALYFAQRPDPAYAMEEQDTSIMHGLAWPFTVPEGGSTSMGDRLIAGGPVLTAEPSIKIFEIGDRELYTIMGQPDNWLSYKIGLTLLAGSNITSDTSSIPDNSLIAYAILYRRVRTNQSDLCKCSVYEKFDSIPIRAGDYRDADTTSNGFRELSKLVSFARSMEERRYDTQYVFRFKTLDSLGNEIDHRDSTASSSPQYSRDSVIATLFAYPGCICIPPRRDTVAHTPGNPEKYTIVRYDTIVRFHVQLYVPDGSEYAYGAKETYLGEPSSGAWIDTCHTYFPPDSLAGWGMEEVAVPYSDFDMKVYSTGVVPITFLRTRIGSDMYDHFRAGDLDGFIARDVDSLYAPANALIEGVVGRMGLQDEPIHQRLRASGAMSRKLQEMMRSHGDTTRQMWQNPPGNFDGYRLLTEDFDTTSVKTVQNITRQDYHTIGGVGKYGDPNAPADRIPIFYANPDKMDSLALYTLYRARDSMPRIFQDSVFERYGNLTLIRDTAGQPILKTIRTYYDTTRRNRMIAFNTAADYNAYTAMRQQMFGMFADYQGSVSTVIGPYVQQVARAVDVAKFKYSRLGPRCGVWNMIQSGGWINATGDPRHEPGGNWDPYWSLFRPPTPEEITAQVWLGLNCNADGVIYSDGVWDGTQVGFINSYTADRSKEYDTLRHANSDITVGDPYGWTFPRMWIGFRSRFNAMQRVNLELRHLDSIVHLTDLVYSQKQMSVHDLRQSFTDIPLIDTLIALRVARYNLVGGYHDTTAADPRDSTYIELTHFLPGPRDTVGDTDTTGMRQLAQYVLVTNRRTFPTDTGTYDATAQSYGAQLHGLGAIDVRRPVIRFKNTFGIVLDSVLIEKVGHESEWPSQRVAIADLDTLDVLEPGWGALYRVIPIKGRGVSEYATAWNNAVRAENPSNDLADRNRVICYERDSAIWLRVVGPDGAISREWLISDNADRQMVTLGDSTRRRLAHNTLPALALARGDSAMHGHGMTGISAMVVWERRDTNNQATVEMLYIDTLPARGSKTFTDDTLRRRLVPPRAVSKSWLVLAPAIVAVEGKGFVVAWGAPNADGIELKAVRQMAGFGAFLHGDTLMPYDTSHTMRAKTFLNGLALTGDTACQYPTLAYAPRFDSVLTNLGTFSETRTEDTAGIGPSNSIPGQYVQMNLVHLAYQQGWRNNTSWQIAYNLVGADFTGDPQVIAPRLWLMPGEHVSSNVKACQHRFPSIAVDSALVGVAWQAELGAYTIVLRFRDTLAPIDRPRKFWTTQWYRWGDVNMVRRNTIQQSALRDYGQPSLRQFPALRRNQLFGVPEGLIAWQWTNVPNNRKKRLVLYRYGNGAIDETSLADGSDPSIMLSPNLSASRATAFTTTSIFHRGKNADRFSMARPVEGDTAFYYPAIIVNTPVVPSAAFQQPFAGGLAIVGRYDIARTDEHLSRCTTPANGGIGTGLVMGRRPYNVRRPDDSTPPPVPPFDEWGAPSTFFPVKPIGPQEIRTIDQAVQVARTSDFRAGNQPVPVRRVLIGNDSLVPWLNSEPYDTAAGRPANIYMSVQLVRASDGTVLWTGDTISARRLVADTIDTVVYVPVNMYAPTDTTVYIRMQSTVSPHVTYSVTASFEFVDGADNDSIAPKRTIPATGAGAVSGREIGVTMIPNPARPGEGTLRLDIIGEGRATITIYDLLGTSILELPDLVAERPGTYMIPVDTDAFADGTYLVEVRMGSTRGIARFTVIR